MIIEQNSSAFLGAAYLPDNDGAVSAPGHQNGTVALHPPSTKKTHTRIEKQNKKVRGKAECGG